MSRGSPTKTMRFPEELVTRIELAITSANANRVQQPYDWTGWVHQAVQEKLRSLARAKNSKVRRRQRRADAAAARLLGAID